MQSRTFKFGKTRTKFWLPKFKRPQLEIACLKSLACDQLIKGKLVSTPISNNTLELSLYHLDIC